jgi:4-diphosphocytidyl-2-C-methyl-D-erythritol kinase
LVRNDFEAGVVARHAAVGDALERLRANGAAYAQMTGSGSSVFGLFAREASARQAAKAFDASSGLHVAPLPPQNG